MEVIGTNVTIFYKRKENEMSDFITNSVSQKILEEDEKTRVITLTGGPVAGKSSLECSFTEALLCRNYDVIWLSEIATEMINSGLKPVHGIVDSLEFQRALLKMQIFKENLYLNLPRCTGRKLALVCDRGALDSKAYMTEKDWNRLMEEEKTSTVELLSRYHTIIHMETAAIGALEAFNRNRANNRARSADETAEVAIALDRKLMAAYLGHSDIHYITNDGKDFEDKKHRALQAMLRSLGEPILSQHQEKIIVKRPNISFLIDYKAQKRQILQTYLRSNGRCERRLRMIGDGKNFVYYLTQKGIGNYNDFKERKIGKKQYDEMMFEMDPERKPIIKDRWYFSDQGIYYNMDYYPNWKNYAVVEIRSSEDNPVVKLPNELIPVKNVTNVAIFSNYALSKEFPTEEEMLNM